MTTASGCRFANATIVGSAVLAVLGVAVFFWSWVPGLASLGLAASGRRHARTCTRITANDETKLSVALVLALLTVGFGVLVVAVAVVVSGPALFTAAAA